MFEILKDGDVEILAEGVFEVLGRLGMICENREILKALEDSGATVLLEEQRARFPRSVVERFVAETRKEEHAKREIGGENKKTLNSGYVPAVSAPARFEAPYVPYIFHPLAVFFYDEETGEKRRGVQDDFIRLTKLGDVLHSQMGVGHSLILSDVPAAIEPLQAALLLLQYAHRPRGVYVQDVRQIDYLLEIEEVAGIEDPYWHWLANVSFATPLKLGKDIADRFAHMVKTGLYPAKVYSMAVSGVSTPVTVGGTTVLTAAELIALWICARALDSSVPLTGMALVGTMDMRTGEVNYGTFDALIRRLSACEFVRKWTGVPVSPGVGEYTSSRTPGLYTALEKAYVAMTIAAFTGHHPEVGIGHLEAGLAISPVQFMLDREITEGLRFLESPTIDEDSLGVETILQVGFGQEMNYAETQHTLEHFKASIWAPEFFDRTGWSLESEAEALNKAREKVRQALEVYEKPEVDPEVIAGVEEVIAKAGKEFLQ